MSKASRQRYYDRIKAQKHAPIVVPAQPEVASEEETKPDWTKRCEVCGEKPIVPLTGMCGPCTFGEAETAGGNW